jgi:4'-phosphopantetheinyl transferase
LNRGCEGPLADARGSEALGAGEIHVWTASLYEPDDVGAMRALLSGDEIERAGRFHFEKDRTAFILARGFLRTMLGRYLGGEVRFVYRSHGKPALDRAGPGFNLSHTDGLALLGLTLESEIGVDVERIRSIENRDQIAERYFSPAEYGQVLSDDAFFQCWTRKEAYIKAVGGGLSIPLKSINTDGWSVIDLRPRGGYVGAVAVESGPWTLRTHDFNWSSASDR